ncbi:CBASS cGAMP-activated phospholipase [Gilvimarinus sp. SDUM040013]|uniref:CBASS cGAMP-activated phospholipase n=1 Tax=Gilvimarinus gilvus TaxID=3058038 RepID=A0ABU4S3B1_9GAMM|nr:CBASS cGAMP-activated phospholipase [Gilvimarinus sp. SDUM040013]MDO3388142.1 CBASS cGAMP-activated phospholipase [Gilvimarinus sp. SDUM040013]MDX6850283.1 CBASS cGAMP-activated phospholipase [Gilvimarinus sp. SDUM040013]
MNPQSIVQALALSGGGYKGLYTATVIADFEDHTQIPFAKHFDLLSGTSIGGIIALALAAEISAQEIVSQLETNGAKIFTPLEPLNNLLHPFRARMRKSGFDINRGICKAKHSADPLRETLESIFGDRTIGDLKHRILIPSVNWTKGGPQFFKTPHHSRFTRDRSKSLVNVALATSAAPIYLPNHEFDDQIYVDGALVGNAPGLFAHHELLHNTELEDGPILGDEKNIRLLAIGALSAKITANQKESTDRGLLSWKGDLFSLMMASQEGVTDFMLKQKLGEEGYYKIDVELSPEQNKSVDLDMTTIAATRTIKGLARSSAQDASGVPFVKDILAYRAPSAYFHPPS